MIYILQCQTNTVPDSLNITVDSMMHSIAQPGLINTVNVTINQTKTGAGLPPVHVQCMWNVNGGGVFANATALKGTYLF